MIEIRIYGKCDTCFKKRWFVRSRTVPVKIGILAKSQKKMCTKCYKTVLSLLKIPK